MILNRCSKKFVFYFYWVFLFTLRKSKKVLKNNTIKQFTQTLTNKLCFLQHSLNKKAPVRATSLHQRLVLHLRPCPLRAVQAPSPARRVEKSPPLVSIPLVPCRHDDGPRLLTVPRDALHQRSVQVHVAHLHMKVSFTRNFLYRFSSQLV